MTEHLRLIAVAIEEAIVGRVSRLHNPQGVRRFAVGAAPSPRWRRFPTSPLISRRCCRGRSFVRRATTCDAQF